MMQVTLNYFIDLVEKGLIQDVFGQIVVGSEKRVYGSDYTKTLVNWQPGKICELVYAVIP